MAPSSRFALSLSRPSRTSFLTSARGGALRLRCATMLTLARFASVALALSFTVTSSLAAEPSFSVVLTDTGAKKISVIKIVREATGLGLKNTKDLVEAPKPQLVRDGLSRAEADALAAELVAAGATAKVQQGGEPVAPSAAPTTAAVTGGWSVKLQSFGTHKIAVIKVVREHCGLGLAESKTLVESAPVIIKKDLPQATAETIAAQLTAAGGKATTLKP